MIGFAGLSHLGIVSSIAVASKGFDVVGYDSNPELCKDLTAGQLPILEPGLSELLAAHKSRLQFTDDFTALSKCNLIFFSKDVPTDESNKSNLSPLNALIDEVVPHVAQGSVLVVLCQVPPGFTRKRFSSFEPFLKEKGISVYYQVETLIFGRAVERALYPERYIVGCNNPQDSFPPQYGELLGAFNCPIMPMRYESAELAKVSINMYLVSSVSVTNTLAELCEAIGANWHEIVPALKLDKRIGQYAYLSPGLGIAGGNLERDLATVCNLANEYGTDAGVVEAFISNSHYRRDWVLKILHSEVLQKQDSPIIAVWGLAYKPDTASTKNSPSLVLIKALADFKVQCYDPEVKIDDCSLNFNQTLSALNACNDADVLVIMTPWAEFSSSDLLEVKKRMSGRVIIDPYGVLDQNLCAALGFRHIILGQ